MPHEIVPSKISIEILLSYTSIHLFAIVLLSPDFLRMHNTGIKPVTVRKQ